MKPAKLLPPLPLLAAFFAALTFGLGLGISGMTLPANIISFLDVGGAWNPSLALVMVGAIGIHGLSYRFIKKRQSPLLAAAFHLPTRHDVDWRLLTGSFVFGVGWGIGGFCPGPALVTMVTGQASVLTFVVSMIAGILLFRWQEGAKTHTANLVKEDQQLGH